MTEQENPSEKEKKTTNETKINHLPDKEFINVYAPNIGAPKYLANINRHKKYINNKFD